MPILINPPPGDHKCHCCGKVAVLNKTFRKAGQLPEEAERIMDEVGAYEDLEEAKERLGPKYGRKKVEDIMMAAGAVCIISASWECADCIPLADSEYFKMRQFIMDCSNCSMAKVVEDGIFCRYYNIMVPDPEHEGCNVHVTKQD